METRRLGNTDLYLTEIGLGTWAIGGGNWKFSWGPQDDEESVRTIRRALDLGMNWIDTAAVYGLGHSEEVVGKAIRGMSVRPIIATKCERCWDKDGRIYPCLKRESVRADAEASLRRLRRFCRSVFLLIRGAISEGVGHATGSLQSRSSQPNIVVTPGISHHRRE
jgi:aryl-alcohol dehydrogenase-like predicted oxidoreductase